ncbi:unnamed protein product [Rhizophagus irregularis]|nr:unnamed protein product [Rhizophagus irregularis]
METLPSYTNSVENKRACFKRRMLSFNALILFIILENHLLVFDESQRNYQNYESVLWCNTQLEKISFTADVYDPKVDVVSTREVLDPNGDELLRIYIALAQIFLSNFLYPIFLLYPNSLILITLLNSLKLISLLLNNYPLRLCIISSSCWKCMHVQGIKRNSRGGIYG